MKINLTNTNYTIAISIAYAALLVLSFAATTSYFYLPVWGHYLSSFLMAACYSWIIVFVINLLKVTAEKEVIINAFFIYLIYILAQYLLGVAIGMMNTYQQFIAIYSSFSSIIGVAITVYLTVQTFMVKHKDIKAPLQFIVLCRIVIMLVYVIVPAILPFVVKNYSVVTQMDFIKYLGLISILVPIGALYLGITVLNLLNSEQGLNTPNYKSDFEAQWPNDKPAL